MKNFYCVLWLAFMTLACSNDDLIPPGSSDDPDTIQGMNLPELRTDEVTDITVYSVKTGGKLISSGDSDIIEVGIVVGLTTLPTIENNLKKFKRTPDDLGNFILILGSMRPNTTYFIRAYAINSEGIGYGNEIQFTSLDENVYAGDITLSTQNEVDEFGSNEYTTIDGSMYIGGTVTDLSPLKSIVIINSAFEVKNTQNLQNLEGLNNLKITGRIRRNGFRIENNVALESLSGLNNLEITRGMSYIINNDKLTNMQGLNSYNIVNVGELTIQGCDNLQSLSGLENLIYIGTSFNLLENPVLNDISALSNLNHISFDLYIHHNSILQNIDGLEGITSLERLSIEDNDNLIDLDGLDNISTISESISISHNDKLSDLSVFQNISTVKSIKIEDNNSLINLEGFSGLTSIESRLNIYNNSSLTSLQGIENLKSLQQLRIHSNPSLINLQGLNGLTTITGNSYPITIGYNSSLNSLAGLENLTKVEGYIQIFNNSILSDFCTLKNLFVNEGHDGNINISNNLNNPSIDEIIDDCN